VTQVSSLNDFLGKYDLYDKGVNSIQVSDGFVEISFSMFHCDDPERNDETKEYILNAQFKEESVYVNKGDLVQSDKNVFGEILDLTVDNEKAVLGISWRNFITKLDSWCEVALTAGPVSVDETVVDSTN
jgi:hypothetical protein